LTFGIEDMKKKSEDWSVSDQHFADISDFSFVHKVFRSVPSLRTKNPTGGHYMMKPYKGEHYDESEFELIEGGWNHQHCSFCFEKILDDMPYWANTNEVIILCPRCYDHYQEEIAGKRTTEQDFRG